MTDGISRRKFVTTVAATGAGFTIVPRHVLGRGFQAPSDTVNIATVGIGGMGGCQHAQPHEPEHRRGLRRGRATREKHSTSYRNGDSSRLQSARPAPAAAAAAADARQGAEDAERAPAGADNAAELKRFVDEQMPKAEAVPDYREMLDKQKDIDGVVIATPDHMHAAIASAAMDVGKHVYVQKPLCWSVHEARHLAKKAKDNPKLVTQMGNQGHSRDEARARLGIPHGGAIGDMREVHVWTNRPLGYWPQGIPRPAPLPAETRIVRCRGTTGRDARLAAAHGRRTIRCRRAVVGSVPRRRAGVDYHPIYHPFNWRGWVDWGQGALGDMGAHLIDHPVWA